MGVACLLILLRVCSERNGDMVRRRESRKLRRVKREKGRRNKDVRKVENKERQKRHKKEKEVKESSRGRFLGTRKNRLLAPLCLSVCPHGKPRLLPEGFS